MTAWQRPAFTKPDSPIFPWLILLNVIVTTFMAIMSTTITLIADETIQGELGLSSPEASWVITFYLLGLNSTVPSASWMSERFGFRKMYAFGVLVFTIGSGFAGLAPNFWTLGACRFVEGIGAGYIFPIGLAMITRNIPKKRLSLALNLYIAISFGGGSGLGMILAGYFSQFASWRELFLLFLPFGGLATLDCWLFHEDTPQTNKGPFDFWGFITFTLFIALLLVALSFGPLRSTAEGWRDPLIVSCFVIAGMSLLLSLWIESRHPNPVIPLNLFKNPLFVLCLLSMLQLGMAFFSSVSSFVSFMLNALRYERFIVGWIASAYGIAMGLSSVLASRITKWIHPTVLTFVGLSALIISYFLNNQITLQSYPLQILGILALRGFGVGLSLGPITALAMATVSKSLAGPASTLLTFTRQVGSTYGGTVLAIMMIKRKIYHVARFAEPVSQQIPGYQFTFNRLSTQFFSSVSDKSFLASRQAELEIVQNIETQAFIQAINDGMMVFGYITIAIAIALAIFVFVERKLFFGHKKSRSEPEKHS